MKIITTIMLLFAISACVAGELPKERNDYYTTQSDDYCEKNPTRCIEGIAW